MSFVVINNLQWKRDTSVREWFCGYTSTSDGTRSTLTAGFRGGFQPCGAVQARGERSDVLVSPRVTRVTVARVITRKVGEWALGERGREPTLAKPLITRFFCCGGWDATRGFEIDSTKLDQSYVFAAELVLISPCLRSRLPTSKASGQATNVSRRASNSNDHVLSSYGKLIVHRTRGKYPIRARLIERTSAECESERERAVSSFSSVVRLKL